MPRSRSPGVDDLRRVFRLVGECRELGADAFIWRQHLLEGLTGLLGDHVGIASEGSAARAALDLTPDIVVDRGWSTPGDRRRWQEFMKLLGPSEAPAASSLSRARPLFTGIRRQLVDDARYYRSDYFAYKASAAMDDEIVSVFVGRDGRYDILTAHRYSRDRDWDERDVEILGLLHGEIAPLVGVDLDAGSAHTALALAPRLEQILDLVLRGLSEKEIASELDLSKNTIHDSLKALRRRYRVSSRAELMALWVPRSAARHRRGGRS